MCVSNAVKFGYKWHVGNGKSIRFWKNIWFGNSPLLPNFGIYIFASNQQNKTIFELWNGHEIRGNFRRTFTDDMMIQWQELLEVARSISFSNEEDQLIWQYNSSEVYSSSHCMLSSILEELPLFTFLLFGSSRFHLGYKFCSALLPEQDSD
jgi:hypothetical protein